MLTPGFKLFAGIGGFLLAAALLYAWTSGGVDWNLLAERDMRQLFPDATLHVEKALGLPKSLIAYRHV